VSAGGGGLRTYAAVLGQGRVLRPFTAAVLARLPLSMAPLGTVLLVQDVRGSYASAGLVTGAYALGTAVGSPLWGRAIDRFDQARVIAPTMLVSGALLVALALWASAGAGDVPLAALAAASGATCPPFSAAMRASWRALLADPAQRRAGYALDASAVEAIFVIGPLLLSLLLVVTPPVAPLLITAGLLVGGGLLYATSPPARRRAPGAGPVDERPGELGTAVGAPSARSLRVRGLLAVLAVGGAMAVAFGVVDTSLAATARDVLGVEGMLGVLFAAIAGGSTLGGLAYGATKGSAREPLRLPVLLGVFAVGLALAAVVVARDEPPLWALLPLLFVVGLTIAPNLIIQQNLVDHLAPAGRVSEAQAWLSTAVTTGAAAGIAVAGALIEAGGVPASFAAGSGALVLAVLVALAAQPAFRSGTGTGASASGDAATPTAPDLSLRS